MGHFSGHILFRTAVCAVFFSACWLGVCPGCSDHQAANGTEEPAYVTRAATSGPSTLTLMMAPTEPTVDDRARLTVELVSQPGVTVRVDDYLSALVKDDRRFELGAKLVAKTEAEPIRDGQLRWRYLYDLSFFLPGDYELPAATASCVDMRPGAEASSEEPKTQAIETEPIEITVRDVREEPLTPEEFATVRMPDPVELRRPFTPWVWLASVGALLALGLVAYSVRRRTASGGVIRVIPAHEWAHQQLTALLAEDLIGRGLAQEFFYRISSIVRGYIERRFSVSAPDMTTEEFLATAASDARFDAAHTASLDAFLTACDFVKYARHEPSSPEADQAVRTAMAFVEQTRVRADDAERARGSPGAAEGRAP